MQNMSRHRLISCFLNIVNRQLLSGNCPHYLSRDNSPYGFSYLR